MSYPIVKTPDVYNSIVKALPSIEHLIEPVVPKSIKKGLYEKFIKDKFFTLLSFTAPIVVIFVILLCMMGWVNKDYATVIGVLFSLCVLPMLFAGSSMFEIVKFYLISIFSYKKNVKLLEMSYEASLKKYEAQLQKKIVLEEKIKNHEYLFEYRRKILPDNLNYFSAKIVEHPKSKLMKKGLTESYVLDILKNCFRGKVIINHTALGKIFEKVFFIGQKEKIVEPITRYTPLPDFLIHDLAIGYIIAIEIDEPYDLEYGYPIHYLGVDDLRDNYFLERSWPIIRFAEMQFVLQPEECCDYIAYTINKLTLGLAKFPVSGAYENLKHIEHWTQDEAVAMEATGFRETYIPRGATDSTVNRYAFSDAIYLSNGPAIRKRRRERTLEEEAEREKQRVMRLRQESEASRKYRYLADEDNDLPF